jgi:hypothetical protein
MATATTEEFDALEYSLDRDATMRGYYKGFDTPFDANRVLTSWQRGEVPVMTWESRALAQPGDTTEYPLAQIASGQFDGYLSAYAGAIRALGLPVVIRFDHEMNGDWYRWSESNPAFRNQRGDYIRAWRHIHDVFAAAGANDLVVWLWSPNRIGTCCPGIEDYYPGAAFVDWVGMTGYYRPSNREPSFAATYDATLDELRRVAPGVPIVLSEVGATEDHGDKVEFVRSFFDGLRTTPDLAGFIWFNYAVSENGHTNDWRLNSTADVFGAFKGALGGSAFGRPRGAPAVLVPLDHAAAAPGTTTAAPSTIPGTAPPPTTTPPLTTTTTSPPVTTPPAASTTTTTSPAAGQESP